MSLARLALCVLLGAAVGAQAAETTHDHGQTDHSQMDHATHEPQPDSLVSPVPPLTAADRAAAQLPHSAHDTRDNRLYGYLLLDRLEYRDDAGDSSLAWQAKGWFGTDLDRLWTRLEGEHARGSTEAVNAELLYGHSVSTWWDVVGGVRQHFRPGDDQTWLALGVQGLAPQRFEFAATALVGAQRRTAARIETEYKLLFTNRLILQPTLELWLHGRDDAARGIGSGLSTVQGGLRLRYEFTRRFAPYLGIEYERACGDTADLRRAAAAPVSDTRLVAGLRLWF